MRSSYNYPPAKLVPFEGSARLNRVILEHSGLKLMPCVPNSLLDWQKKKRNKSSLDLDRFHQQLLLSSNDKDLLHGFWSVVFWGYFSGTYTRDFAVEHFDMYKLAPKYDAAFQQINDISTSKGWYSFRSSIGPITRAI